MRLPLQITFRNTEHVPDLEAAVRRRAEELDRFCDHVMGCRVVIDVPHKHHRHGNQYHVRVDITVPGEELVVNREPPEHGTVRDPEVAVREAFETAGRLLEDYVRRRRGFVKTHAEPGAHAKVRVVLPGQDHGFLETADGREVYFHRHSLVGADFDRLVPGTEVTFVEEPGEKGPQASTVHLAGRHHQQFA
jgi:cold shock CspA family protein